MYTKCNPSRHIGVFGSIFFVITILSLWPVYSSRYLSSSLKRSTKRALDLRNGNISDILPRAKLNVIDDSNELDEHYETKSGDNYSKAIDWLTLNFNQETSFPNAVGDHSSEKDNNLFLEENETHPFNEQENEDSESVLAKYSYRSVPGLKALVETEYKIYTTMKFSSMEVNKNVLDGAEIDPSIEKSNIFIQAYLRDYEESNEKLLRENPLNENNQNEKIFMRPELVSWNPIATYKMIWRFVNFIQKWSSDDIFKYLYNLYFNNFYLDNLDKSYQQAIKEIKQNIYKSAEGPNEDDLTEVKLALLTMQYVYDLNATEMASGLVAGIPTGVTLSAQQCVDIGMVGISEQMFTVGIEWLEAALVKVKYNSDASIRLNTVEDALIDAIQIHDAKHELSQGWEPYFYSEKFGSTIIDKLKSRQLSKPTEYYDDFQEVDLSIFGNSYILAWGIRALEYLSHLTSFLLDHFVEQRPYSSFQPVSFNETEGYANPAIRRDTNKQLQYDAFRLEEDSRFAEINFNGICSGKPHQTPEEKSKLFCWFEHEIHPYWKIQPLKAEFHSLRPKIEIVQYYDLLSDKLMNTLRDYVATKLVKSSTLSDDEESGEKNTYFINSKTRSSANSWVNEKESEAALKVLLLIEMITGLNALNTPLDDMQIAAYAPGAYYGVHVDVDSESLDFLPERLATFMFYFSDVQLGGSTAFCQAGAKTVPQKGSAVFWYNIYSCGEPNDQTWHGACPVIFGEKWVANKWLTYSMQKKHVCHTTSLTPDEVLVNGKSKYGP